MRGTIVLVFILFGCAKMHLGNDVKDKCVGNNQQELLLCQKLCKTQPTPNSFSHDTNKSLMPSLEEIHQHNKQVEYFCYNHKNSCPLWNHSEVTSNVIQEKTIDKYIENEASRNFLWSYVKTEDDYFSVTQEAEIDKKGKLIKTNYFGYSKKGGVFKGTFPLSQEQYFSCRQLISELEIKMP